MVLDPVPFWWWGETEVLVPGPDADSPVRHNIEYGPIGGEGPNREYHYVITAKYPVLKRLDYHGQSVLEGDEVRALAEALSDIGSDPETPGAELLSLAGRMLERASRVPCKVVVDGL
jgi:hypothetical protein